MLPKLFPRVLSVAALFALGSCQAMYLGTLEQFGFEKREILYERVETAGDSIVVLEQRLDEAFSVYREAIHQEGGDLLSSQKRFSNFYDKVEDAASNFDSRIEKVQAVADAMFEEWNSETGEIIDAELRRKSRSNYTRALNQYGNLLRSMRAVQAETDPILTRLRDHVLFMKLNLHPNAYAPLRKTETEFVASAEAVKGTMHATYEEVQNFLRVVAN